MIRLLAFLLLTCSILQADVLVLKEGGKVIGQVMDKKSHYEVKTDVGKRTFLKDEVERIDKDPKRYLGDADELYENAKKDYLRAGTIKTAHPRKTRRSRMRSTSSTRRVSRWPRRGNTSPETNIPSSTPNSSES